jgi:4-amino-4-deoxy-L-arabinose transferase-like glycosyltransferase
VVFGAGFGFALGRAPLAGHDEGRYAEIPREMLATGDWVTPRLDGVAYFEKPPLVYWMVAAGMAAFGPGEGSLRAVPAFFGVLGVLLTYAAARALRGRIAGVAAAVVLGTSLLYFAHARLLLLDMAVAVLMSATLFLFILAVREPPGRNRRLLLYGMYASAALATLTKGLIGFLLTGAVMVAWLALCGQWRRLRPLHLPTGGLLFLAIAAPWHILVARRNPTWAHFYFIHEHWERFTTTEHHRDGPWWYFIPIVLLGLFPWTGFLWPALREALAGGWSRRRENAQMAFFAVWAGFVFLFFSKSHSKLIPYIIPVFPPLAVITGAWLARRWTEAAGAPLRGGLRLFALACGLLAVALCVVALDPGLIRSMDDAQAELLRPFEFSLAAILAAGAGASLWLQRSSGPRAALGAVVATAFLFYGGLALATGDIQPPGTREIARVASREMRPGDRVFHYHAFFQDFAFYARRLYGTVAFTGDELELPNDPAARASGRFIGEADFRSQWTGPGRILVVARKRDVGELFADPSFHYHLLAVTADHYLFTNQP